MNVESSPMERAQRRLAGALDALESAVRRRQEQDRSVAALEAEVRVLSEDRSRLAQDLDKAQARAVQLESLTKGVSERLDSAIGTVRGLLEDERSG